MQEANGATESRFPSPGFSVSSLRRASPQNHPVTRTLHLTEAEHSSRETTPLRVSIEDLSMRPRSNPRSRTPMRFESPLNHSEFRRESLGLAEDDEAARRQQPQRRVTIRPLAGTAMGTIAGTRIREDRPVTPKSRKQGPSHRKLRRWNNDHFSSLASEIASSSRGVASVLTKAHNDAHLYKNFVDLKDHHHPSEPFHKMMNEIKYESLRERFLDGELPVFEQPCSASRSLRVTKELNATMMLDRIDSRLKRVVIKAGTNSQPAFLVMNRFEMFVKQSFADNHDNDMAVLGDLLLLPPSMSKLTDSAYRGQFFFHPDSPAGGFHRLLLHAICQFHGLQVASKTAEINTGEVKCARTLTVTGRIALEDCFRLTDCLTGTEIRAN